MMDQPTVTVYVVEVSRYAIKMHATQARVNRQEHYQFERRSPGSRYALTALRTRFDTSELLAWMRAEREYEEQVEAKRSELQMMETTLRRIKRREEYTPAKEDKNVSGT